MRLSLWRFQLWKVHSKMRFFHILVVTIGLSSVPLKPHGGWPGQVGSAPGCSSAGMCQSSATAAEAVLRPAAPGGKWGGQPPLLGWIVARTQGPPGGTCGAPGGTWGHLGVAWKLLDISSLLAFWSLGQHFNKLSLSDHLLKVLQH